MPRKDVDPFSCFPLTKDGEPTGRWRAVAQTRDASGRLRPKMLEGKTEEATRKKMREFLRAHHRLNPGKGMSVDAMLESYLQRCEEKKRAASTMRNYRRYRELFRETIGHTPIDRLMPLQIEAALNEMEGAVDARNARAFLRAAINKVALKADPTMGNNVASLAEPPEHEPLERERLTEKGLAAILEKEVDPALRVLWLLLGGTGMRPTEARTLMWPEVEEREDGMWVRKVSAKTAQGKRPIPVPPAIAEALRKMPKKGVYVFPSPRTGRPYDQTTIGEYWAAAVEAAELPAGINLYQLRHLFGTVAARKHKDHVLRRLMRHTDVRTTKQYYVDEDDEELRKAVDG